MDYLEYSFNEIITPSNFIKNFKDNEQFKEWARTGTINDLKKAIITYEYHEEYKHCRLLQDVINEKVDSMLDGLGFKD